MRLLKDFTGISRRAVANPSDRSRSRPDSQRAGRHRCILGLERLEDRVVLSPFLVTNTMDNMPGQPLIDGSLRQAIALSNSTPGPNEVDFAPGLSGTIGLTSGQLQITNDVRIVGPGADVLSVSGNNASRVFDVDSGTTATFSGLTINGGSATEGGGVLNQGNLTITASAISDNTANNPGMRSVASGGGIFNGGALTITDCTINRNSVKNAQGNFSVAQGGGISSTGTLTITASRISGNTAIGTSIDIVSAGGISSAGTLTINASTISDNTVSHGNGGGITSTGTLTINASTISGNTADDGVGGIDNNGGTLTITDSTISGNGASIFGTGSIENHGHATVTNSTISGSPGTGIGNEGTLTVTASTISGNKGDGIFSLANTLAITDSTISGNTGPGVHYTSGATSTSSTTLTITNSTISNNGNGLFREPPVGVQPVGVQPVGVQAVTAREGQTLLVNSIVAGNHGSDIGLDPDIDPDSSYNLIGVVRSGQIPADKGNLIIGSNAPGLGPLADNGGLTQTMALLPGSPAIDAGSNVLAIDPTTGRPLTTDQRGLPRIYNGRIDIGAFEAQPGLLVTNLNDDGPGSLRAAIAAANSDTTDDAIAFAGNLVRNAGPQTLTLTTGQLTINKPQGRLTIAGLGAALLSISGNNLSRVFEVDSGTTATLSGLTITGGDGGSPGGGLFNNGGALTIDSCTITGNTNSSLANLMGTVAVSNSTVSLNSGGNAGGLYNVGGTLTVTNSGISNNSGFAGGIDNVSGTLTIDSSTIRNNTASFEGARGGGILNETGGIATVTNSTISGNSAEASGGGIDNNGTLTLNNITVSGNTATNGGGIGNDGLLAIAGGAISDNTATGDGGGIFNGGGLALAGVTIRRNRAASGGGVANGGGGVLALIANDIGDNQGGDVIYLT